MAVRLTLANDLQAEYDIVMLTRADTGAPRHACAGLAANR